MSGGNLGDPKLLAKRCVRRSMFSRIPDDLSELDMTQKRAMRMASAPTKAKAKGKDLEAKCFPWIYPKGTGYWVDGKGDAARSFEEDMEIKLKSVDSRWRDDDEWADWAKARASGGDGLDILFPEE
ncbi:hypothetical protein HK104_006081 [Borealophlyctis nickersoniae]|nr:hypothetical protein HK104_006081 [Borealophlyctis nickersoniae]